MQTIIAAAELSNIGAVATALTGSGFAVWYAWYVTTTQIPKIQEKHGSTINLLVTQFRAEQRETRESFDRTMRSVERQVERSTQSIDLLCDKLNAPGPMQVKTDSVVVRRSKGDTDQYPTIEENE